MIGNRRLARNAVWNVLSMVAPMLVALVAIPPLIRALGADRFGILTLAWMLIGYCSLFDLGLGRALTKLVSEGLGAERPTDVRSSALPSLVWTALALMLIFGCVGALIFSATSGLMAKSVFKIPLALQAETMASLYWIAAAIPLVTLTAGLRGILEAHQQFGPIGIVRATAGVLTFAGPLLAAKVSGSLSDVVLTLALIRLLTALAYFVLCAVLTPALLSNRHLNFRQVAPLLRFGGWFTLSSLISPFMVSIDRFLIGIFLSVTSVAYYATPYEIVTKLQVVPAALAGVLFPAFGTALVNNRARAKQLYFHGLAVILALLLPLTAIIVIFAHPGLSLWLGEEFATHGYRVLQLLAVGVMINAAAFMPASLLHAAGRPDVTAKLHMIELPIYIPLVYWLIQVFGIEGAAVAWVVRVTLDAALLFYVAGRAMPSPKSAQWNPVNAGLAAPRLALDSLSNRGGP